MKKGQTGLKELVATLVVTGILLIIGIMVFSKVSTTSDSMLSTDATATATVEQIETSTYDSFELATVALIVLAAAVIIGILIRSFGA